MAQHASSYESPEEREEDPLYPAIDDASEKPRTAPFCSAGYCC